MAGLQQVESVGPDLNDHLLALVRALRHPVGIHPSPVTGNPLGIDAGRQPVGSGPRCARVSFCARRCRLCPTDSTTNPLSSQHCRRPAIISPVPATGSGPRRTCRGSLGLRAPASGGSCWPVGSASPIWFQGRPATRRADSTGVTGRRDQADRAGRPPPPTALAVVRLDAYGRPLGAGAGPRPERIGNTPLWVLPNPSCRNADRRLPDLTADFRRLHWTVTPSLPNRPQ